MFLKAFYIAYIFLFSYVILCDFFPLDLSLIKYPHSTISPTEIVLIIWTGTFGVEEIRKVSYFQYIDNFFAFSLTIIYFLVFHEWKSTIQSQIEKLFQRPAELKHNFWRFIFLFGSYSTFYTWLRDLSGC